MGQLVFDGGIEVICGPMFAGKTEELLRRLNRIEYAKIDYIIFKPVVDTRSLALVKSRNGKSKPAIEIHSPTEIFDYLIEHNLQPKVIAIDEVQFFDESIIEVATVLANKGFHIILAGLDKDFKGESFGCIPQLLVQADTVTKLSAVCTQCGSEALFSQRIINGEPADYNSPIVLIGDKEEYEARCRKHFVIANRPLSQGACNFIAHKDQCTKCK